MSKALRVREGMRATEVNASAADARCVACDGHGEADDVRRRQLQSRAGLIVLRVPVRVCNTAECGRFGKRVGSEIEAAFAPPYWTVTWDLLAWMGHRRLSRHWSVPQIRHELRDRFLVEVSDDWIEDNLRRYQVIVAGRESDLERMRTAYAGVDQVMLTIDGLQPEKGHETLYVVRELELHRVWFAEPLLCSSTAEVRRLFERAKTLAEALRKPVRVWMSDKQAAFVRGVAEVFPGVPHRYCNNHFLRDLAKPVLEKDSHAKVQMRRKVRGLRAIEKNMLARVGGPERVEQEAAATPVAIEQPPLEMLSAQQQVVMDYCAAVRGILNDDQGGPLTPPGVRMDAALGEVQDSIERLIGPKKGGPTIDPNPSSRTAAARRPCASCMTASTADDGTSPATFARSHSTP